MQRVDINHDGVIQLTEFVAGLVDWKQLQSDSQWGAWVQVGALLVLGGGCQRVQRWVPAGAALGACGCWHSCCRCCPAGPIRSQRKLRPLVPCLPSKPRATF